ncbi:MAG: hypothetical protein JW712_13945 [Dehalococcoidales bacterium]|nr:hypothetical protein [Dehalococcoidales bacterium]
MINKLFIVFFLLLVTFSFSCNGKTDDDINEHIWHVNNDGSILTTDLDRLQDKISFDIIIPNYIPSDQQNVIPTFRYEVRKLATEYEYVSFLYGNPDSSGLITISEEEAPEGFDLGITDISDAKKETLLAIEDIVVNERSDKGFNSYRWVYKGVLICVEIDNYSQEESRKIIESMIK